MKTRKCKHCGTQHHNTTEESAYREVGDTCMSCQHLLWSIGAFISAMNNHAPMNVGRPNRKLTIIDFKIEKI